MQKNTVVSSFEQIQTPKLPKKALRIIKSVAKDIRRSTKGSVLEPKQLEIAYATLHMRLYQSYGRPSEIFMREAYMTLADMLQDTSDFSRNTRPISALQDLSL